MPEVTPQDHPTRKCATRPRRANVPCGVPEGSPTIFQPRTASGVGDEHHSPTLVSLSSWCKWRSRWSAAGAARTRRCCSCRCRRGVSGVVVGRPRVRRARGGDARVFVVLTQVAWSSVGRGCGAQGALVLASLSSGGKWHGRRSPAGASRTRRLCSCRCRRGASGVVVGRSWVRRGRGSAARVVVVGGQVVWSSVGRNCGTQAALLLVWLTFCRNWRGRRSAAGAAHRGRCCLCRCRRRASGVVVGLPRVRRARISAARVVVVGGHVARSSVGRGCGAHAALLLVSLSFWRKWRGRLSTAGAARSRRCCSCRGRRGASGVVVCWPRVWRARRGAACVVVVLPQVARSSVSRGCGAHATMLPLSLSFWRKWRGRRSAAEAAHTRRCCSCR